MHSMLVKDVTQKLHYTEQKYASSEKKEFALLGLQK